MAAFTESGSEASSRPPARLERRRVRRRVGEPVTAQTRDERGEVAVGFACLRGVFESAPTAGSATAAIAATADAAAAARVMVNLLMLSLLARWTSECTSRT